MKAKRHGQVRMWMCYTTISILVALILHLALARLLSYTAEEFAHIGQVRGWQCSLLAEDIPRFSCAMIVPRCLHSINIFCYHYHLCVHHVSLYHHRKHVRYYYCSTQNVYHIAQPLSLSVAQWLEHLICVQKVTNSAPCGGFSFLSGLACAFKRVQ